MNNRKSITRRELLSGATGVAGSLALGCGPRKAKAVRPNIVVILADDMGFADPGCFGGEIDTPNLNRLAAGGLRYTSFYSTARCCPTRASLLSGLYPHQTGMGWMTAANLGRPAYSGNLNRRCVTIAEALKPAGYSTYISGKWHVVRDLYTTPAGPKDNWPLQRGFDRYFGTLLGAGNYFDPATLTRDNEPIQAGEGFYYTDAISDNAIRFITDHRRSQPDQPFFLYTAFTAPHWPLHAKPEDIEKYRGRYAKGWEPLRRERHARMIDAGIVDPKWRLSRPDPAVKDWDALSSEQKEDMALRMAIYAAQVDSMDQGIGRILQSLEETASLDNTLLLFLSDNGACQEEIHSGAKGMGALGKKESFESYGRSWANAGNTPFRLYKHYVHEGGIASPLIVHWPERIRSGGGLRNQPGHVIDVMATALDVARGAYPAEYDGNTITPIEGKSLVPSFDNQPIVRDAIFWEHEGNQAVRQGDWKVVSTGIGGKWELYNLAADRTETNDLAASEPERVGRMTAAWQHWAKRCDVLPMDGRTWGERIKASVD